MISRKQAHPRTAAADAPPMDRPVAAGRAESHPNPETADDEMAARVREALRADSRTSRYADTIGIETRGGIIILRGMIYDQIDNQNLLEVASTLAGVVEVADRLEIPMLELELGA